MMRAWPVLLIAGVLAGCATPYDTVFPAGPGPGGSPRYTIMGDIKSRDQDVVHRIVEGASPRLVRRSRPPGVVEGDGHLPLHAAHGLRGRHGVRQAALEPVSSTGRWVPEPEQMMLRKITPQEGNC